MPIATAIDLGTTSTAAVAIDETGQVVHMVRQAHGADVSGLSAGHAEQSPEHHWECAIRVLRELTRDLNDEPVCLGLTGQMHSVLLLNGNRRPLGNLITWQDRRANEKSADGEATNLENLLARCNDASQADTGCRLSPGYAAVTLFSLRQRGLLPTTTLQVSLLADWVAAELTDGPVVTERSNAASTGVYDLRHDRWSRELIAAGELEADWFPEVVDCRTPVGRLSNSAAAATGLPEGLPVIVPIGDNQASVLGSVPQGDPAIQITIGTGGQINWPVETFVRCHGLDTRPLPPDRMMLVGAGMVGGDAYACVNRTVHSWLQAFGFKRSDEEIYERLNELANDIDRGADGLTCQPFFRGTRREPLRRAQFDGVEVDNFSPGHVARAVLEGIATSLHQVWLDAGDHRPAVSRIIGCGNGLEQNPLLMKILREQFELPVFVPQHGEAAARGAAMLAGVSVGLWPDLACAGELLTLREATGGSR